MSYIIETENLCKSFPLPKRYRDLILHPFLRKEIAALQDVNISVRNGELFGLLGPNGSGKTTLLKILCTLILPSSGKATINGLDVTAHESKVKKMIGYVISDERSFFWRLTGRQNLRFFASLNNISREKSDATIEELVSLMGLEKEIDNIFLNYSSGNKQKMAIARGLLTDPQILFLDEPTRSLDPVVTRNLRCFIKETLVEKSGKTVFIATNNMQEAEFLCDRIAIVQVGKIKQCGTIRDLKHVFQEKECFVLGLKGRLEKIKTQVEMSGFIDNAVSLEPDPFITDRVLLVVEISKKKESISDVIEWLVNSRIKIESCTNKELPLSEVFERSINA